MFKEDISPLRSNEIEVSMPLGLYTSCEDLDVEAHRSIRLKIGGKKDAAHPGGVSIFGKGFGNYDQDIVLRLHTRR